MFTACLRKTYNPIQNRNDNIKKNEYFRAQFGDNKKKAAVLV